MFLQDKSGNVATIFAFALAPVSIAAASSFEYALMRKAATEIHQSLDGALVSVAKNYTTSTPSWELDQQGQLFLDANLEQIRLNVGHNLQP